MFLFIEVYRKAFLEADIGNSWEDNTVYLYLGIIIMVILMGMLADNKKAEISRFWIIIISIILIAILGLRGRSVGVDTSNYQDNFVNALSHDAFSDNTTEPGYHLLQKSLRTFFSCPELAIFIYSAVTVFFVMKALWRYKNNINLFIAIAFYVGIFYFQAMDLLRIYLAAAFILWNYDYLIEKRYKKFVLVILLTSMLHFSSLVMFLPLGYLWLYQRKPKIAFLSIVVFFAILIPLTTHFEDYLVIARYAAYGDSNESSRSIGLMFIFEYLPCFYCVYYASKNKIQGQWTDILVSLTIVGLLVKILAYYITIAGRLGIHFIGLYILVLPYFIYHMKRHHKKQYIPVVTCLLAYLTIRIHLYFIGYLAADGIMPYNFFWDE